MNDVTQNIGAAAGYAYGATAEKATEAVGYLKEQAQALGGDAANAVSLDEIGRKIASLGAPAIAFAIAASIAGGMGLAGGAVVTTALAMLGGPAGMIGGLIALGILTLIADAVGKYGIEAVLLSTFSARREQGISTEQIHTEIDDLWISDELKHKLKTQLARPQP
jgi:fructose-specific phosphotransferase system IIC component